MIFKEKDDERDGRPLTLRGKILMSQHVKMKDTCWRSKRVTHRLLQPLKHFCLSGSIKTT